MTAIRALALVCLAALLAAAAAAAASATGVANYNCGLSQACFPWNSGGPACSRKGRINLRFQLQVAAENAVKFDGIQRPVDNVTYAYCPKVDDIMSVNISKAGALGIVHANGTTSAGTQWAFASRQQVYLKAVGFGEQTSVDYPRGDSQGRVLIADLADTVACPQPGTAAVVPFVTLNVSLKDGKFEYFVDFPQPAGVGFMPSCDRSDKCKLDSSMTCIGSPQRKNCARCVTAQQAGSLNVQAWVSYFGTDSGGRHLRSGSNSPLNFVKFSGSAVGSSVTDAFEDVQSGNVIQPGEQ